MKKRRRARAGVPAADSLAGRRRKKKKKKKRRAEMSQEVNDLAALMNSTNMGTSATPRSAGTSMLPAFLSLSIENYAHPPPWTVLSLASYKPGFSFALNTNNNNNNNNNSGNDNNNNNNNGGGFSFGGRIGSGFGVASGSGGGSRFQSYGRQGAGAVSDLEGAVQDMNV